jgi:hypothetical protein
MSDDPAVGGLVLFNTGSETWLFMNGSWSQLSIPGPSIRQYAAMAYDAADGYDVLFGGTTISGSTHALGDTWIFENRTWKNITSWSSRVPGSRYFASIAYDFASSEVVLFGGTSATGGKYETNDTWAFRAGNWTNLSSNLSPPARYGAMMADDPTGKGVLLFGGNTYPGSGANFLNDTWSFSNGLWTNRSTFGPSSRYAGALAYDPFYQADVLFGGISAISGYSNETWIHRIGSWVGLNPVVVPAGRAAAGAAYDSSTGEFIVFSGTSVPYPNDTWIFGSGDILLNPNPARDGGIVYNGSAYSTPSTVQIGFGVHPLTQYQFPWARFANWSVTGNLTFVRILNTSGLLTVLGNGTVTVNYRPFPTVSLFVLPPSCGQITLGGQSYQNGASPQQFDGNYSATATGCGPTYTFGLWRVTGNLSVANSTSATTTVTVLGNGSLTAVFSVLVTIAVSPASFGWVTIDGVRYGSQSQVPLTVENHSVGVVAQRWSSFRSWQVTAGNVQVVGSTLVVGGIGFLTAKFQLAPLVDVAVTPSACGPVTVGGIRVPNGGVATLSLGADTAISASPCPVLGALSYPAYLFHRWIISTNLSAASFIAANSSVVGRGNGTLTAEYAAAFPVSWYVRPAGAGTIGLNGTGTEVNGSTSLLAAWQYKLTWNPAPGYGRASNYTLNWSTSGGARLSNGMLSVAGPGTVTLVVKATSPGGNGTPVGGLPLLWWGIAAAFGAGVATILLALFWHRRQERRRGFGESEAGSPTLSP